MSRAVTTDPAYLAPESRPARLHAGARRFMPGGNTRASVFTPPHPPYAAYGHGCWLVDVEGTERIDLIDTFLEALDDTLRELKREHL